jgi:hypothetical protein
MVKKKKRKKISHEALIGKPLDAISSPVKPSCPYWDLAFVL